LHQSLTAIDAARVMLIDTPTRTLSLIVRSVEAREEFLDCMAVLIAVQRMHGEPDLVACNLSGGPPLPEAQLRPHGHSLQSMHLAGPICSWLAGVCASLIDEVPCNSTAEVLSEDTPQPTILVEPRTPPRRVVRSIFAGDTFEADTGRSPVPQPIGECSPSLELLQERMDALTASSKRVSPATSRTRLSLPEDVTVSLMDNRPAEESTEQGTARSTPHQPAIFACIGCVVFLWRRAGNPQVAGSLPQPQPEPQPEPEVQVRPSRRVLVHI